MNTPGIEFGRKTSAAYAALCKPLCQKLHLPQTAFDILMFLAINPGYQTASDVVEVRKLKANLYSGAYGQWLAIRKAIDSAKADADSGSYATPQTTWTDEKK